MSAPASRALWSAVDAAANPFSMMIMLAGFVRTLGATEYGILTIALAASGITMAVNPAISVTTTKFVSEFAGHRSPQQHTVQGTITTALAAVLFIDLTLVFGTAIWREPLSKWVFGQSIRFPDEAAVLLLATMAIGIQQVDAVLSAALRGLERFRRQALIEIGTRGVITVVQIAVAWRSGSVLWVLTAQCVLSTGSIFVRALALRLLLPGRRLFGRSTRNHVFSQLSYGGWMWITAIASAAYNNGDRIIVGRELGAAEAGKYSIYVQLTQLIHFLPSSLIAFSLPSFSRLSAQGTGHAETRRAYKIYVLITCAGALGITIALMVGWSLILRAFGLANGSPDGTALLLAGNFLLLAASVVPYYLLLALGQSRIVSLTTASAMLASLLLMLMLTPQYGLIGVATARFVFGIGALSFIARANTLLKT